MSGLTLAVLAALATFLVLGWVLHHIIPDASQAYRESVAENLLILPSDIRPKPKDKFTYLGLLLASPFILAGAAMLARRLSQRRSSAAIIYLALAVAGCLVWTDPYWATMLPNAARSAWTVISFVFIAVLLFTSRFIAASISRRTAAVMFLGALLLSTGIAVGWRWFGIGSVIYEGDYEIHYDAVAYAVSQIANGATCLADVTPQYGCYGEFMAPIMWLRHPSTLAITSLFTAAQLTAVLSIGWAAWHLMERKLVGAVAVLWIVMVTNRMWLPGGDWNFQNMPVRALFPALSLIVVSRWIPRPSALLAAGLGVFAGLSIFWNLESGATVLGALGLLVTFSGCTAQGWSWRCIMARRSWLASYAGGAVLTLGTAYLYLCAKAGIWVPVGNYLVFQATFFGSGAYMLPMPAPPTLWALWIASAIVALVILSSRMGRGPRDERLEETAYLAVVAVGIFVYYNGRSHYEVLALVSWPFMLLLAVLIDRAWPILSRDAFSRSTGLLGFAVAASVVTVAVAQKLPIVVSKAEAHWRDLYRTTPGEVATDAAFIRATTRPDERVEILSTNQTSLYVETGFRSAVGGMSWIETLRKADAKQQMRAIDSGQIDALFLGYGLCCIIRYPEFTSWVREEFPEIKKRYALVGWSPNGTLMQLVPRSKLGMRRDLFTLDAPGAAFEAKWDPSSGRPATRWGQPVELVHEWPFAVGREFALSMKFFIGKNQAQYATIVTNHQDSATGFTIEMDAPGKARLYLGTASGLVVGDLFDLAPDSSHQIELTSTSSGVRLTVDDHPIYEGRKVILASTSNVLTGKYYIPGRDVDGKLEEFHVSSSVHSGEN